MNYRRLGKSGLQVSEIGLGTYLTFGEKIDEQDSIRLIHKAFDLGINFFDTANVYQYGKAEQILGKALTSLPRSSYVVGTKAYYRVGEGPNDKGLSRKHIMDQVHCSLKRMGLEYIDIFYCHSYDQETPLEETLRAIDDLIRQGKILYAGVSNWTVEQMSKAVKIADEKLLNRIIVNQCEYSIFRRDIEKEILPASKKLGISQVIFSPLAQGILTGKYRNGIPQESRANNKNVNKFFHKLYTDENVAKAKVLEDIAQNYGLTLSQLALLWVLRERNVSSALIGVSSEEQLVRNLEGVGKRLDVEILGEVEQVL